MKIGQKPVRNPRTDNWQEVGNVRVQIQEMLGQETQGSQNRKGVINVTSVVLKAQRSLGCEGTESQQPIVREQRKSGMLVQEIEKRRSENWGREGCIKIVSQEPRNML